MSIPVPTAGSPILDTWGALVAAALNKLRTYIVPTAIATNGSTAAPADLFTIPVVAGRQYAIRIAGTYQVSATNQGLQLAAFDEGGATGTLRGNGEMHGNASPVGETEWRTIIDTWDGRTSTDAQNAFRQFWLDMTYDATGTGDLIVRFARGGTSGGAGVTIHPGTSALVIGSA